jgi:hypothetical protein
LKSVEQIMDLSGLLHQQWTDRVRIRQGAQAAARAEHCSFVHEMERGMEVLMAVARA